MKLRYLFAGSLCAGLALFFAAAQSWGKAFATSADVVFMIFSGGCAVLAFVVVTKMGWRGKFGSVYFGLFIGMLLIFLGDVNGGIYDFVLRVATPFPSFADLFYLLGYAVALVTLSRFLWFFRKAIDWKFTFKLILLFIISSGGLILFFLVSKRLAPVPVVSLDVVYPILDGLAIMLSIMILAFFRSKFISPPWRWFALGLLLIGTAHFLNGLGTAEGWYSFPDPIDLLYLWAYVSFGLGFSILTKPETFWRE